MQKQFWLSFVDDRFDLDNAIQTEAEFSCAFAGWEDEESWVGSKLAARMWIYTKAVICNSQFNIARIQDAQIQIHHGNSELGL